MTYLRRNKPVGTFFIDLIVEDQNLLRNNIDCYRELSLLGSEIDLLTDLIYSYTNVENENLSTDDEIINWTFPDVIDDLISAIWNIYSGLYKTSASCLRNAYEISFVSLYLQIRENMNLKNPTNKYNIYYSEWDKGETKTPSWGITKPIVKKNPNIINYDKKRSCNIVEEGYSWFSFLCNFTHSRPFDKSLDNTNAIPTNSMNIGVGFDVKNFESFIDYSKVTISWIATFWSLCFPEIFKKTPLDEFRILFNGSRGIDVYKYISKK